MGQLLEPNSFFIFRVAQSEPASNAPSTGTKLHNEKLPDMSDTYTLKKKLR